MKSILVTGALGQIGSELVVLLRKLYGTDQVIASDIRFDYNGDTFNWSPDATQLAVCNGAGIGSPCRVVRLNLHVSRPNVSSFAQTETCSSPNVSPPLWTAKGDAIYFLCDGTLWRSSTREGVAEPSHQVVWLENRQITQLISKRAGLLWTLANGNAAETL